MRTSNATAIGATGESYVKASFEELGWIVTPITQQDTGTDLYLLPRDEKGNELTVLIGAQVKTGNSAFAHPKKDPNRQILGWTFYCDHKHVTRWINHPLPHIIILYNLAEKRAYWQLITRDSVHQTKRHFKIFVPKTQSITQQSVNALAHNAAMLMKLNNSWAHTAWSGAKDISPSARLRHALITPRLTAPHPNSYISEINGIQALSTILLARNHLRRLVTENSLKTPTTKAELTIDDLRLIASDAEDEWAWSAAKAIYESNFNSNHQHLLELYSDILPSHLRAAAAVITCSFHINTGDNTAALSVISRALGHTDYNPVDNAWLNIQRARLLLALGSDEEAQTTADKTLLTTASHRDDLTASAISAAAMEILFDATRWRANLLDRVITFRDNPADWWRRHLIGSGLSDYLQLKFDEELHSRPLYSTTHFRAHNSFVAASEIANYSGNQHAWRWALTVRARFLATMPRDTYGFNQTVEAIRLLRQAGEDSDLLALFDTLMLEYPTQDYCDVVNEVDLSASTPTSVYADISLLRRGHEFLTDENFNATFDWAMKVLHSTSEVRRTWVEDNRIRAKTVDLLTSLTERLNSAQTRTTIEWILGTLSTGETHTINSLPNLMHNISIKSWTEPFLNKLYSLRRGVESEVRTAIDTILVSARQMSWQEIIHSYLDLGIPLINLVHDYSLFPGEWIPTLISQLEKDIETASKPIEGLIIRSTSESPVVSLAKIASVTTDESAWSSSIGSLETLKHSPMDQRRILEIYLTCADSLSTANRARILEFATKLSEASDPAESILKQKPLNQFTTPLIGALVDKHERSRMVRQLLLDGPEGKLLASLILKNNPSVAYYDILLALSSDSDARISGNALFALAQIVNMSTDSHSLRDRFSKALTQESRLHAEAVIAGLKRNPDIQQLRDLVQIALTHPSWIVRSTAEDAAALCDA